MPIGWSAYKELPGGAFYNLIISHRPRKDNEVKNLTKTGLATLFGGAFTAFCLAVPAPSYAADLLVMIETPTKTCVPGQANDIVAGYDITSGVGAVDIAPTGWQPVAADGSSTQTFEVQIYGEGYVYAEGSWMGDTFVDDGSNCGQEPAPIVIPIPPAPATSPDDPSKEGDVQWVGFEDSAKYVYGYNADGELFVSAGSGYVLDGPNGNVMDHGYGFPPDVYNPPTVPIDPTTPPDNGGGTGDDGSGGNNGGGNDNDGSTPPASTPDTSTPPAGDDTTSGDDSGKDDAGTPPAAGPEKDGVNPGIDGVKQDATGPSDTGGKIMQVSSRANAFDWTSMVALLGGVGVVGGGFWLRRRRTFER